MNKKSRRSASFSGCGFGDAFFPFPSIHFNWRRKRRRIWCCIKNYYPESKAEWLGSNECIFSFLPQFFFFVGLQSVSFANRSCDRMKSTIWHKRRQKGMCGGEGRREGGGGGSMIDCLTKFLSIKYRTPCIVSWSFSLLLVHPTRFLKAVHRFAHLIILPLASFLCTSSFSCGLYRQ